MSILWDEKEKEEEDESELLKIVFKRQTNTWNVKDNNHKLSLLQEEVFILHCCIVVE